MGEGLVVFVLGLGRDSDDFISVLGERAPSLDDVAERRLGHFMREVRGHFPSVVKAANAETRSRWEWRGPARRSGSGNDLERQTSTHH